MSQRDGEQHPYEPRQEQIQPKGPVAAQDPLECAFGNHPAWDVTAQQGAYVGRPFNGTLSIGPYTAIILTQ